jgi:hypothetical protein
MGHRATVTCSNYPHEFPKTSLFIPRRMSMRRQRRLVLGELVGHELIGNRVALIVQRAQHLEAQAAGFLRETLVRVSANDRLRPECG